MRSRPGQVDILPAATHPSKPRLCFDNSSGYVRANFSPDTKVMSNDLEFPRELTIKEAAEALGVSPDNCSVYRSNATDAFEWLASSFAEPVMQPL
jgi:hypothetical protein